MKGEKTVTLTKFNNFLLLKFNVIKIQEPYY